MVKLRVPTHYSYVVQTDYGPAPNPFWGVCTLVICKPQIRRAAQVGDWIVGTGPANSPIGDIRGMMIYAMQVTDKMPMREYDMWAQEHRPEKTPQTRSSDPRRHIGDVIWDFSENPPRRRPGSVHGIHERDHDLRGQYALLSDHSSTSAITLLLSRSTCRGWSSACKVTVALAMPHMCTHLLPGSVTARFVVSKLYSLRRTIEPFDSDRIYREHYKRVSRFLPRFLRLLVGEPMAVHASESLAPVPFLETATERSVTAT